MIEPPMSLFPWLLRWRPRPETWRAAVRQVAQRHGITIGDLRGRDTRHAIARPRQELMWILHRRLGLSLKVVGRLLGGRDHGTIHHGVLAHERRFIETERAGLRITQP